MAFIHQNPFCAKHGLKNVLYQERGHVQEGRLIAIHTGRIAQSSWVLWITQELSLCVTKPG